MTSKTNILSKKAFQPASSVFASANAGAGKTSLLTKRVLSLLLHGAPPEKILCLTFTHAASAEMQSRILHELGRWVMVDEKTLQTALSELLDKKADTHMVARARSLFAVVLESPQGLQIKTIHGLCQSLLRRFSLEAGISPHFSIMDARTQQELLQEARVRLYSYAGQHDSQLQQSLAALASMLGEYSLQQFFDEIIKNKRKFQSLFVRSGALSQTTQNLRQSLGLEKDPALEKLINQHFNYDTKTQEALKKIISQLIPNEGIEERLGGILAQWLCEPESRTHLASDYLSTFITQKGTPRKKLCAKETLNRELLEQLLAEQERVLAFYNDYKSLMIFERTTHMLHIAEAYLALYETIKRGRAAIDYDDLILTGMRLLSQQHMSAWVMFKLDGGIDHLLVDEAQDTSPEQWHIISTLTHDFFSGQGQKDNDRSLFIVGDEKQSIYSFQGADVAALSKMQEFFAERIEAAAMDIERLSMNISYRSTPEVLRAVDSIFSVQTSKDGLMTGNTLLTHTPTRYADKGLVELWPLIIPDGDETISASTLLARHIADTLQSWFTQGLMLESKGRCLLPGDIMILVKSRTRLVDRLVRALKRRNIPVAGIDRMVLGDSLVVQDLIALGQSMLLPEDDLTLAAVLKSPIFCLDEETLYGLCYNRKETPLWLRLAEHEQCKVSYALFADLRTKVDYTSPYQFYTYVLDNCGARARFLGRMGMESAEPIDEFLHQILLFEKSHTPSMQGFLHWFTHSESEIKRDMEQAACSVRIMTVHAAKGLQAPVVILPDTTNPPRIMDNFLWSEEDVSIPFWPGAAENDDVYCSKLRYCHKQRIMQEYRRLLYVALTRAEDRLYICGASAKEKISEQSWYELVKSGLSGIAEPLANGLLRLGEAPEAQPDKHQLPGFAASSVNADAFAFLHKPPPQESSPSKPLTPSKPTMQIPATVFPSDKQALFVRGKLIHRLLQYLPEVEASQRLAYGHKIASSFNLPDEIRKNSLAEALALIENTLYGFLFSSDALAEAAIAGNVVVAGKTVTVSGQIDRLYIGKNEIWIVDFKTGVKSPRKDTDIPESYIQQIALYQKLIQKIYPDLPVVCALLWTADSTITLLDERLLSTYI